MHYIFADDDPDVLTAALSRHATSPQDRAILIDLSPAPEIDAGYSVLAAASLSPDWAVTSTRVSHTDTGTIQGGTAAGSLVLEIEGLGFESTKSQVQTKETKREVKDPPGGDYAALLEQFEKGMGGLRKAVEVAEGRRRVMEAEAGEGRSEGVEEETQMPDEETQRPEREQGQDRLGAGEEEMENAGDNVGDVKGKGKEVEVYAEGGEHDDNGEHTG